MKITKSQLKEVIRENLESLPIENLIGGISSLVDGMDPELVGVVFTTVFKEMEGGAPPESGEEPDGAPQIGFDREPEEISNKAPASIGFEENLVRIIKEEINSDPALLAAINKLADKIDNLDVSVDYLAASVTGDDPLALGYGQAAFGRAARKKKIKPPAELAEIIEQEIEEVSSEKQRRWACAQKDKSADERADSLSAAEAEEMCTSKVEEET